MIEFKSILKRIVGQISAPNLPQIVRDQFYGENNDGEANKEEENEMIAKFQELMWAVKQDKEETGEVGTVSGGEGVVKQKFEDWQNWCKSHPYILAFACTQEYSSSVYVVNPFHTARSGSSDLNSVKKSGKCKWVVLNNGNQGDGQLHTLVELKGIVKIIEGKNFPKEVRDQFYGKGRNFRLIASFAVLVIALIGIGIFFCLKKSNKNKTEKSEK